MEPIIRPYDPLLDREGLLRGITDLQEYERRIMPDTKRPGPEIAEPYLEHLLRLIAERSGAIFVAHTGEELVGFIVCYVEREDSITKTDLSNIHGYISDAWVDERYRKQGIFTRLNERAEEHLKQVPEIVLIRLYVLAENQDAVAAYNKTGYVPEEILLMKRIRE